MDLHAEAGNSVDDEVTIVGVSRSTKSRAGKLGRAWTQRWTTFPWNRALVLAAMRSGVAEFWKDKKSYGKMGQIRSQLKDQFYNLAKEETTDFDADVEGRENFVSVRGLWNRLEDLLNTYETGRDYKAAMTETEWMGFLQHKHVLKEKDVGYKKWKSLHDYCMLLAWTPTGEDDPRYPQDCKMVEQGERMEEDLTALAHALACYNDGKEHKKEEKSKEAWKMSKKDSHSIALERYVALHKSLYIITNISHACHRLATALGKKRSNKDSSTEEGKWTDDNSHENEKPELTECQQQELDVIAAIAQMLPPFTVGQERRNISCYAWGNLDWGRMNGLQREICLDNSRMVLASFVFGARQCGGEYGGSHHPQHRASCSDRQGHWCPRAADRGKEGAIGNVGEGIEAGQDRGRQQQETAGQGGSYWAGCRIEV